MTPEVDFRIGVDFCVYLHLRPDGSVFYVGKGTEKRAHDFAPSRRTIFHKNIVKKYGRENIAVRVIPAMTEREALALEKVHIAIARAEGAKLANLTDGGEGASGRRMTDKQRAAMEKGRRVGKRGTPGPRPWLQVWKNTPAGQRHMSLIGEIGRTTLHRERTVLCAECGCIFQTMSAKAKCCSRRCEQQYRRSGNNK